MAKKIIIDAGHGGADSGAVYQGREEKKDTLQLALAVGDLLKQSGYDVYYTRTEDIYDSPYEKAQKGNMQGGDLFLSIHRNSSEHPNMYEGVETLVYDKEGKKVEIAERINDRLEQLGFRNHGIKVRPNLIVLNSTAMPAVLVEAGFINNDNDNALFDEKFWMIANAITEGIKDIFGTEEKQGLYAVQTGAFYKKEYAEIMNKKLKEEGYPSYILQEDDLYRVLVGAYEKIENALNMQKTLQKLGYQTFISRQI